ncbi:hypothetical protein, partial [Helicobacter sp. MIT 14-3879]|uniref:hypothetical protein n=1 Tax=Helicobacter sp. MIT 14-3879 TaxID=2040649 RepID=UPI000E36AFF4
MQIQINVSRLEYLLELFKLSKEDLQREINAKIDFNKPLTKTILKKIDDVFKMGLDFYTNPLQIDTQNSSILFRKAQKDTIFKNFLLYFLPIFTNLCEKTGAIKGET